MTVPRSAALRVLPWLLTAACALPGGVAGGIDAAAAELVDRPELAGGRVGVLVVDAATGDVLAQNAADFGFATASNMKLVSASVALSTLGADATTATELWQRGEVRDGVLHGDLVLVGHGDPTFAEARWPARPLDAFAAAVRQRGITRVSGRVLGDGSWQGQEVRGLGWQWDYLDDDYAAPFGGLNCLGNVVRVAVTPGADGAVKVAATANAPLAAVAIEQVAAGQPTRLRAFRRLGRDEVHVQGRIAADAREQVLRVAVNDPALAAATALHATLHEHGVQVEGGAAAGGGGDGMQLVATHRSPPLGAIVGPLLTESDNLYAEQVWRWAARTAIGDGSTAAAERHAQATLRQLGVDPTGMVLADGSGLSRRNLVRPRQLAELLLAMWRSPWREPFAAGLPVAGETGTLRSRMTEGPARGRVRAKTGYISRVVCLSGYVPRPDTNAPPLVFVVMLNDFTCSDAAAKAAVDAFVQRLASAAGWR